MDKDTYETESIDFDMEFEDDEILEDDDEDLFLDDIEDDEDE